MTDGRRTEGSFLKRLVLAATLTLLASIGSAAEKHSGYDDAGPETRAMQDDDASNPGFLWVQQGEALWSERAPRYEVSWDVVLAALSQAVD